MKDVARLFGIPLGDAEEALHSERAARVVLSRRSLVGVAAALAAGSAFAFGKVEAKPVVWSDRVWVNQRAPAGGDGSLLFPVRTLRQALEIASAPCHLSAYLGTNPIAAVRVFPGDYSGEGEVIMTPNVDLRAVFPGHLFGSIPPRSIVTWDFTNVTYDLAPA